MSADAHDPASTSRRAFLKTAGVIAGGTVVGTSAACAPDALGDGTPVARDATSASRVKGFRREQLDAVADVVLPASLGERARRAAADAFVAFVDGYDPVAEEMHGYGYADVRYLPPDPAPAWRAQLDGLDILAQRTKGRSFAALDASARAGVLSAALRGERTGDRLPSPLMASHVAIALLAHWTSSPEAWNSALGVQVAPATCRPLGDASKRPLPVVESHA